MQERGPASRGGIARGAVSAEASLMTRRLSRATLVAALLLGGAVGVRAQGRPLRVIGLQPLDFGTLLGGVPTTVLRTDPLNAGRLEVRGERGRDVLVSFLLPAELVGPGASVVPLSFGPGSAGYSPTGAIDAQAAFDPSVPDSFALPGNGRATIYLGGSASPPPQPRAGTYFATITLTVSYLGN